MPRHPAENGGASGETRRNATVLQVVRLAGEGQGVTAARVTGTHCQDTRTP